jgi:hypothetical protein
MKKLITIMSAVMLISTAALSQNVQTYRYTQSKGILAKPSPGEIKAEKRSGEKLSEHRLPEFKGKVPAGITVYKTAYAESEVVKPADAGILPDAPAPCLNYQGLNDTETGVGLTPPDVNGSVGPANVLVSINNGIKIQNLANGANQYTGSLATFFAPLSPVFPFDPKTLYDPYQNRWIVTCPDGTNPTQSRLLLAVSQTSNPLGAWFFYAIDVDPVNTAWFDYPSIGFNRNWIVITGNMFGSSVYNAVFAIDKLAAYGGTATVTRFGLSSALGFTLQPALTYNNTENTEWLCNDWNGNSGGNGFLRLFNITGTPAAPVFNSPSVFPSVSTTWSSADQNISTFGCTSVRAIDGRMRSLVLQGGSLWAVHKIGLPTASPTRASSQWWEINPATGAVNQFGRIDDPTGANMYFNPSLSVNANRDVLIGFSHFSSTAFPRASYTYRAAADPLNTLQPILDYQNSSRMECTGRWGDYSSTITDPNGTNMWTLQQYAPAGSGAGTWWSMVCPPVTCPATLAISTPSSTANTKFEVSVNIVGTSTVNPPSGFVKFDAGQEVLMNPGFETSIAAGAEFSAYIDGCGGLRIANNEITRTEPVEITTDTRVTEVKVDAIEGFSVYPNPAENVLNISIPSKAEKIISVEVFDAQGRRMKLGSRLISQSAINISSLTKGSYFIKVRTADGEYQSKFIKE